MLYKVLNMPVHPAIWCLEQMFELSFGGTVHLFANFFHEWP